MNSDNRHRAFDHPLLNSLLQRATRKTELALQYDRAQNLDDLFLSASEPVCLAAFEIMSSFRLPKRGLLVLRFLRWINRSSYNRYWQQSNRLFSECVIFVVSKLRDFVNEHTDVYAGEQFFAQITTWSGVQWYKLTKMSDDEIERFKNDITEALMDFENNLPSDQSERGDRIINALGHKPTLTEIPAFAKAITLADPLRLVEPIHFSRNYERLAK